MEQESAFSVPEIVGIATAGAAALGGLIVGLGRAQSHGQRHKPAHLASLASFDGATAGVERGREALRQAGDRIGESWPELRGHAESLVERLADVQHGATARVADAATTGSERTKALSSDVIEIVQESVVPAVGALLETARERSSSISARTDDTVGGLMASAGSTADRAVTKTTSVARETLATLFWLGAASAVVYFALLSEERRERVKAVLYSAFEKSSLLVRDFQGYDEEI